MCADPPSRPPSCRRVRVSDTVAANAEVSASGEMRPATSATGTPAAAASSATWVGALPAADCPSKEPSPVTTTDAPASAPRRSTSSATSAAPGTSRAPHASSPKPTPPAAPAPGASGSPGSRAASRARPASARVTPSASSPFCGPNTAAEPPGPRRGFVTSVSTTTPASGRERRRERSAAARVSRPRAPSGMAVPPASANLAPRAVSMPVPPSVDELLPMPSTRRETPWSSAAVIASPKPDECASSGRSPLRAARCPRCEASSTTPVPCGAASVGGRRSQRCRDRGARAVRSR